MSRRLVDALRSRTRPRGIEKEIRRVQLIEGWFGALEGELRQTLQTQAALADHVEQFALARALNLETGPRSAVDVRVNAQVAIGVIELEEKLRDWERQSRSFLARYGRGTGPTEDSGREQGKSRQATNVFHHHDPSRPWFGVIPTTTELQARCAHARMS